MQCSVFVVMLLCLCASVYWRFIELVFSDDINYFVRAISRIRMAGQTHWLEELWARVFGVCDAAQEGVSGVRVT